VLASLHNGLIVDPFKEFAGEFRCISQDLRNAERWSVQRAARKSTARGIPHRRRSST